ncbi:hypothetical protein N9Z70_00050 [Mariniblastus sp.]|nr:hypothetical protein [Mariniblastus sp.]
MKIELICEGCQSVLNVDSIYAGKQARCPNCQCVNSIPSKESGFHLDREASAHGDAQNLLDSKSSEIEPFVDKRQPANPYQAIADHPHANATRLPGAQSQSGLVLGIISLVMVYFGFFFCCIFPMVGFVLGVVGLLISLNTPSEYRTIGLILNSISVGTVLLGIIIGVIWVAFFPWNSFLLSI